MGHEMRTPTVTGLGDVIETLRSWQVAGSPFQLHPGDVGWFWRLGSGATARALRTWSRDGRVEAVGLLDGPGLLRLALAPALHGDVDLAQSLFADLTGDDGEVLPSGEVGVEAPPGALVHDLLGDAGWQLDEPWTLLDRDLSDPVETTGLTVLDVGPDEVGDWCAVHLGAFAGPGGARIGLDEMRGRWLAMAEGLPHTDARSLLGVDDDGTPVAAVTVWSGRRVRAGQESSSRWASTRTTTDAGTGGPSRWPRPARCESWGPATRWSARRARTSAPSRPTSRPGFVRSASAGTVAGPEPPRARRRARRRADGIRSEGSGPEGKFPSGRATFPHGEQKLRRAGWISRRGCRSPGARCRCRRAPAR